MNNVFHNLLPEGGTVCYHGRIMESSDADYFLRALLHKVEWKNDEAVLFGKKIITKRKVAWYGDEPFEYTYSNVTKLALPWTKDLLVLKDLADSTTGEHYNSCLLNLYHNGQEGMAWHSDNEKDLKKYGAIASISLGAERSFSFKHKKSGERISLILEHGSLLVMKGATQENWLHRLSPTRKPMTERVNLTFRTIIQ